MRRREQMYFQRLLYFVCSQNVKLTQKNTLRPETNSMHMDAFTVHPKRKLCLMSFLKKTHFSQSDHKCAMLNTYVNGVEHV